MRVLKFGGTSVADADAIRRVVAIVAEERRGEAIVGPVVVVSALGGVTDQLLEVAALAQARRRRTRARAGRSALHTASRDPGLAGARRARRAGARGHRRTLLPAARDCRRRRRPARSVAPIARRHCRDRRAREQPARHRGARRRRRPGDLGRSRAPSSRPTRASPRRRRSSTRPTAQTDAHLRPALDAGRVIVTGGFVGATRHGITSTLGRGGSDYSAALLGAALERRGDPDLDRRRRHAHRRSARRGLRAARAVPVVCRGRRARVLRREGAAPQDHSAGCGAQYPGAHPQHLPPDGGWHPHRRRRRGRAVAGDGAGLQEGDHRRHDRIHEDADGVWLPAAALRSLRTLPHAGGRRLDVGSERVGDHRRPHASRQHRRGALGVCRRHGLRANWPWSRWSATATARSPRPSRGWCVRSRGCRCGWCRRPTPAGTSPWSWIRTTCPRRWPDFMQNSFARRRQPLLRL